MANVKKIMVKFLGTTGKVSDSNGKPVKIGSKEYSNIRVKNENDKIIYSFAGANYCDLGNTNIANNVKNAVLLLSDEIDKWVFENRDNDDTIQINIFGHSRGGVTTTRVADKLRDMYRKNKKIKISLCVSDPYAGPTHKGKNVSIDLKKNKEADDDNDDVVFYSMGTTYPCSPQKIMNAKAVVICESDHKRTGRIVRDCFFKNGEATKLKSGAYLMKKETGEVPTLEEIKKENLKKIMDEIYKWKKSYSARTRVLTEVIVKKLNLKIDDVLETGAVREWNPAFEKTLGKIEKSSFLKTAFKYVFELFSDKLFGPYINKKGEFFRHIENAKSAVAGIGNNDYEEAINQLDMVIDGSKQLYKAELALALKERIMRYYNLDKK